jgi:integrase
VYWIKYYRNGKPYRESSKSKKEADAKRLLKKREGEISNGKLPGVYFDKVRFEELAEDFLLDYEINGKKSLMAAKNNVRHLRDFFEGAKIPNISTPKIKEYIENRMSEGASHASINRELAALKRMMNLGAKQTPAKVDRVPYIPMLRENNIRKGFFEHGEFLALREAMPEYLKGVVTFAYKVGWRISEIANLKWAQVDLSQGIVRLEPGESKNDEGRTVYIDDEIRGVLEEQRELRKSRSRLTPYVFLNNDGTGRLKDFRKAWANACKKAGLDKRHFHDFRRTAVRNMVRAGVPERVAMMVSGHKTRSIFERYNIVNDSDLRLAALKQEEYLRSQVGTISGTIPDLQQKRGQLNQLTP